MRPWKALVAALAVLLALGGPAYAEPAMMRFDQQQQTATPIDDPILLDSENAFLLEAANLYFFQTPLLDVRAFNSYGIELRLQNGTTTNTDLIAVNFDFYADAAGTTLLFAEEYLIFKTNIAGSARLRLTDQMHGAYFRLRVENQLSARTVELTFQLYGSYRPMSNAYLRASDDGDLYNVFRGGLGAGANDGGACGKLAYGQAMIRLVSDAVPVTLDIRLGGTTVNSIKYTLTATVANTAVEKMIVLPRQQAFMTITNNAAGAANVRAMMYQLMQPF